MGLIPVIIVAVGAGFYTGLQKGVQPQDTQAATNYSQGITHLFIDGYRITFLPENHPEMQGKNGFTYKSTDNDIYIQKGLSKEQTITVCNHEMLHDLGIGEEHHDFIYRNDENIESKVCRKLRIKLINLDGLTR